MAAIMLPTTPAHKSAVPSLVTFSNDLIPIMGGEEFHLLRMGSRFAISVTLPPMLYPQVMEWSPRLAKGRFDKVLFRWPQPRFNTGNPGVPLVNGALVANSTAIPVKAFQSGYVPVEGQYLSILTGGRRYLHMVTSYSPSSGTAGTANVWPPTRKALVDNDPIEFRVPLIEGFPQEANPSVDLNMALTVGLSFSIREAA